MLSMIELKIKDLSYTQKIKLEKQYQMLKKKNGLDKKEIIFPEYYNLEMKVLKYKIKNFLKLFANEIFRDLISFRVLVQKFAPAVYQVMK